MIHYAALFTFTKYFINEVDNRRRAHCRYNPERLFNCTNPRQLFRERKKYYDCSRLTRPVGKKKKQAFAPTENRKMHRKARYCGPFRKIDRSREHFQNDRCTVPVCRFLFPKQKTGIVACAEINHRFSPVVCIEKYGNHKLW